MRSSSLVSAGGGTLLDYKRYSLGSAQSLGSWASLLGAGG